MTQENTNAVELFRYLRTLVEAEQQRRDPFPKFALVEAYWHIGRIIVETEQAGQERADYGIHLIEYLSARLTENFGKGYSLPNMWRFKQFYLAFPILSTIGREFANLRKHLRTELSWSHYRQLMSLQNLQERAFYLQQAADERWTVAFMRKMIRSRYYFQTALGEKRLLEAPNRLTSRSRDGNQNSSHELELDTKNRRSRLAAIKRLLLEDYVGYAFVNQRQYVSVSGQDKWVDILFFHIVLNRYVLIQLTDHNPTSQAEFVQILDAYLLKQPPTVLTLPIGLLVNPSGQVQIKTSSKEFGLSEEDQSMLPLKL